MPGRILRENAEKRLRGRSSPCLNCLGSYFASANRKTCTATSIRIGCVCPADAAGNSVKRQRASKFLSEASGSTFSPRDRQGSSARKERYPGSVFVTPRKKNLLEFAEFSSQAPFVAAQNVDTQVTAWHFLQPKALPGAFWVSDCCLGLTSRRPSPEALRLSYPFENFTRYSL